MTRIADLQAKLTTGILANQQEKRFSEWRLPLVTVMIFFCHARNITDAGIWGPRRENLYHKAEAIRLRLQTEIKRAWRESYLFVKAARANLPRANHQTHDMQLKTLFGGSAEVFASVDWKGAGRCSL